VTCPDPDAEETVVDDDCKLEDVEELTPVVVAEVVAVAADVESSSLVLADAVVVPVVVLVVPTAAADLE
jgi:hypothetical protein